MATNPAPMPVIMGASQPAAISDPKSMTKIHELNMDQARSWAADSILFSFGLNVIVGDSDSGKTNIYRNLCSLVENDSLEDLGRDGRGPEATCQVDVLFGDNSFVRLVKGGPKKHNDYEVRPRGGPLQTWTSVGNAVPDEVAKVLRLSDLDFGGERISPNFSSQRGPAFLVDSSPAVVARVIGAVSSLDHVFRAVRAADTASRDAVKKERVATETFNAQREHYRKIKSTADIPAARQQLESAELMHSMGRQSLGIAADLNKAIEQFQRVAGDFSVSRKTVTALETATTSVRNVLQEARASLDAAAAIDADIAACQAAIHEYGRAAKQTEEARLRVEEAREALKTFVQEQGVCPLCGGPNEHLLHKIGV